MKLKTLLIPLLAASMVMATADTISFDLQPPDGAVGEGLGPVDPTGSNGTGNEIETGIWWDGDNNTLVMALGYGESTGFENLTGPATAAHIHGPDPADPSVDKVLFNLGPQHFPNSDPALGGIIRAAVEYSGADADALIADLVAGNHYVNVHTDGFPAGEIRGHLIAHVNYSPTVTCPDPVVLECASPDGTEHTVTVEVADQDGEELQVVWFVNGAEVRTDTIPPVPGGPSGGELSLTSLFTLGDHEVMVVVSDGVNAPVECTAVVTVEDTTPPTIERIGASPSMLWPPNHKMRDVKVRLRVTDNCGDVTSKIVKIESRQRVNDTGDGNTEPDWEITGDLTAKLRAERAGNGGARVYVLTVEVTDASGNMSSRRAFVTVPHSQSRASRFR